MINEIKRNISNYFDIFFQGRLLDKDTNSTMFRHGDEGLTPKLLSTSARIAEREVRGSIPVRDDGNFAG